MVDLVVIHGPALSSFIHSVLTSESDFDGILLGAIFQQERHFSRLTSRYVLLRANVWSHTCVP